MGLDAAATFFTGDATGMLLDLLLLLDAVEVREPIREAVASSIKIERINQLNFSLRISQRNIDTYSAQRVL